MGKKGVEFLFGILILFFLAGSVEAAVAFPGTSTELRAQACSKMEESSSGSYIGICDGSYPASCGGGSNDRISCNDNFNETQNGKLIFLGINVSYYNSSITNCNSINDVFLCYEWWINDTGQSNCFIAVDANGGTSPTNITTTCPGTTQNPGVTCTNVTSSESWTCNNFFSASGTRAIARNQDFTGGGAAGLKTDVLFFNVSYTIPGPNITSLMQNNSNFSNINLNINYTYSIFPQQISSCFYSNDTYSVANKSLGSGGTFFNITNITWGQGKHNVTVYCNDTSNYLNWSTISFTIDSIAPNLNISFPSQNNSNSSNNNLDINFTFSDVTTNIDSAWYSNDTYSVNLSLGSGGTYFNITNLTWSEGKHNVTIYVNDSAGNLNQSTISFTVDTTAPSISITNPSQNNTMTAKIGIDINYTFSDSGVGINSCWYSNDTYSVNTTLENCGNITNVIWSDAYHNVTIYANDSVGNLNSASVSFTVKSSAPDTNYVSPTENSGVYKSRNYLIVNVTAVDTNLDSILIRLYDSTQTQINFSLVETSPNYINFSGLSDGLYYYNATANDTVNNFIDLTTRNITLDTTNPSVTSFSCTPSSVTAGNTVTCSCSGTDALSGVQTTSFTENPSTTNTGTFSETCTVTDFAGNQGSATTSYIVEGGGTAGTTGGGGGTISGEPITETTHLITSISPEAGITITGSILDSQETLIKEIQINVNEQVVNVKINIAAYDEKPTGVSFEKEGIVYKYLRIDVENLDSNLQEAKITLQIGKSKIANGTSKENIALFKLDEQNNVWNELPTNYTSEDENYYYYETVLSSFSFFAIGEKTFVQKIVSEITESYERASQNFLTLVAFWIVFAIIVTAIVLVLVLILGFFISGRTVFWFIAILAAITAVFFAAFFFSTFFLSQKTSQNILSLIVWELMIAIITTLIIIVVALLSNLRKKPIKSKNKYHLKNNIAARKSI
ncbi:PGF-pre-PGF domain-containing protein [Candidatus Pacearchaeota archaeon]|nr:PGF-pre-PGF domain-containing protein [Candidatus Pacearchaeota archaeon]